MWQLYMMQNNESVEEFWIFCDRLFQIKDISLPEIKLEY